MSDVVELKVVEDPPPSARRIPLDELRELDPRPMPYLAFKGDHFKGQRIASVPSGFLCWFVRNTPENIRGPMFRAAVAELIYREIVGKDEK